MLETVRVRVTELLHLLTVGVVRLLLLYLLIFFMNLCIEVATIIMHRGDGVCRSRVHFSHPVLYLLLDQRVSLIVDRNLPLRQNL